MIFGISFPNFDGGDWRDFHRILQGRMEDLRGLRDVPSGVSEETHHISLACDLVEACLQKTPEDRQVAISYVISVCQQELSYLVLL